MLDAERGDMADFLSPEVTMYSRDASRELLLRPPLSLPLRVSAPAGEGSSLARLEGLMRDNVAWPDTCDPCDACMLRPSSGVSGTVCHVLSADGGLSDSEEDSLCSAVGVSFGGLCKGFGIARGGSAACLSLA